MGVVKLVVHPTAGGAMRRCVNEVRMCMIGSWVGVRGGITGAACGLTAWGIEAGTKGGCAGQGVVDILTV